MSIGDGFRLWIGKTLADLAIAGVVIGLIVLAVLGLLAFGAYQDWRRKRRAQTVNGD